MRRALNLLYLSSAWAAAAAMVGVLVMVMLSVLGRLLHFHLPGADAYAGYAMAGAGFLALAHTLKKGEHIRVTLIIGKLTGKARKGLELWALSVAVALSGLFAFYAWRLVLQSREFNDISTGSDATPLWIPQLLMAVGTNVLLIAFLDDWLMELRGQRTETDNGGTHHE
jgi:TRAP-type C4-dicarboxylate transport system permease small subunit